MFLTRIFACGGWDALLGVNPLDPVFAVGLAQGFIQHAQQFQTSDRVHAHDHSTYRKGIYVCILGECHILYFKHVQTHSACFHSLQARICGIILTCGCHGRSMGGAAFGVAS